MTSEFHVGVGVMDVWLQCLACLALLVLVLPGWNGFLEALLPGLWQAPPALGHQRALRTLVLAAGGQRWRSTVTQTAPQGSLENFADRQIVESCNWKIWSPQCSLIMKVLTRPVWLRS